LFGSVRQIKLATCQLLGARRPTPSYRIVSYRIVLFSDVKVLVAISINVKY